MRTIMPSVTHDGLQAYAAAYANDPSWRGTVYLSLIGYRASVRAIWAALLDGQYVRCDDESMRRIEGVPYRTHSVALPENGLVHFAMLATSATQAVERGQPFYVLREDKDDNAKFLARFVAQFDAAVGVPTLPTWSDELWRAGLVEKWGLIAPCSDARNIAAWRVEADNDAWLALIQEGIQSGRLAK